MNESVVQLHQLVYDMLKELGCTKGLNINPPHTNATAIEQYAKLHADLWAHLTALHSPPDQPKE